LTSVINCIRKGGHMTKTCLAALFSILLLGVTLLSGQNLLQNPGFEVWIDDSTCQDWYTTYGVDAVKESTTIHGGSYSAKLFLTSTSTERFEQYYDGAVTPGNDYQFSFWAYDNDPYGRARVTIRWFDAGGGFISGAYGDYTTDSTEWQQINSWAQQAPASAESAHVEVRMYDVSGFTDSAVVYVDDAEFLDLGASTPPETLTIYEIQGQQTSSPYLDSAVVTYGIVTGVYGSNTFFIEEQPGGAWHGIYVYGSSTTPSRGDSVRVTATVDEYFGMTELVGPVVDILSSSAVLPGPTILTTGAVNNEDYESVLVRVVDAICTNDSLGNGEWEINDGSGSVVVDDMGVPYVPDSGQIYTVTGPVMYSFGDFKIEPRDSNDIIAGSAITEHPVMTHPFDLSLFPNITAKTVNIFLAINRSSHVEISLYTASGRKVTTLLSNFLEKGNHTLSWSTLTVPDGIYFIKVISEERTSTEKVTIIR
jgi:hypothetical protein